MNIQKAVTRKGGARKQGGARISKAKEGVKARLHQKGRDLGVGSIKVEGTVGEAKVREGGLMQAAHRQA